MKSSKKNFRLYLVKLVISFLIVILLWGGLLTAASLQNKKSVNIWVEAERSKGNEISYDDHGLNGFPFYAGRNFANFKWKNNFGESTEAKEVTIYTYPWNWRAFFILLTGARIGKNGKQICSVEEIDGAIILPSHASQSHEEMSLELSGKFSGITLPADKQSPFGNKIEMADFSLRVMGALPDSLSKKALAAWNDDSGVIELDNLILNWGDLKLTGNGTFALNNLLQPEGAFTSHIKNYQAAIDSLKKSNFMEAGAVDMLKSSLDAIVKANGQPVGASINMPISIQEGGLFLGPALIFTMPDIEWAEGK